MAALTATYWTESVESQNIQNKQRVNLIKLTLSSTQAGTYPSSGGIPLPTTMGMVRNVDYVNVIQDLHPVSAATGAADSVFWQYIVTDHAIHGYWETHATSTANASATTFVELPTTFEASQIGTSPVMYVEAKGW